MLVLSFVKPLWMIFFIIVFDVYWVLKVVNFVFYLSLSWYRSGQVRRVDWKDKIKHEVPDVEVYRHVVFLTLYNEEWEVVETAVQSVCDAMYNAESCVLVVAGEERTRDHCKDIISRIENTFGKCFGDVVGFLHPVDLPDEIPGKGSNLHYAERQMQKYIDKRGWKYEHVIATIFDIDTVCHEQYFAYLTYLYATHPNPTRTSFQPIALYNNNMWESPSLLRIMSFGTTFWMMTSLARQDALVTFSSHSMSFRAIADVGFHDKRIVSEDSRIFYQCLLQYDGEYDVTPMYIPVSMDTVRDDNWWKSIKNLYKQQRRWAWGVEHIPYLLSEFRKKGNKIPFWKKAKWVFVEWEGKWSWALVALVITIVGRLPLWVAPASVRQSALFFNTPHTLEVLMSMAMLGLVLSAILSIPLLPKRPKTHPKHIYIVMILQWALLPISMIFLSAIPAIDAATHMMFGKYLGFNVSQKKRKKQTNQSTN